MIKQLIMSLRSTTQAHKEDVLVNKLIGDHLMQFMIVVWTALMMRLLVDTRMVVGF